MAAPRRVRACDLSRLIRFWSDFLTYIILIGFANCISYGGHRLVFGMEPNAAVLGLRTYDYVLHFHVLMDSRLASGRSCSKKVRFFSHRFSRKIGLKTGIEIVLGTLLNSGCDACFLIFFFFF